VTAPPALGVWGAISGLAAAAGVFLGGFQRALLACAAFLLAAAVIALRSGNTRSEPAAEHPAAHDRVAAPELAD
jgi:hypothetical protein